MIIVKLMGGLGNQMFQYAAGLSLARMRNTELLMDLSFLKTDPSGAYTKRDYELAAIFPIKNRIADINELSPFLRNRNSKIKRFLQRKFPAHFRYAYMAESGHHYHAAFTQYPPYTYLDGFWQSEKYFAGSEVHIQEAFKFSHPLGGQNLPLLERIQQGNSVSLHVRRGDYVANTAVMNFHGVCGKEYYLQAVEWLSEKAGDLELFVFSDDTEWCRQNLRFDLPITYVDHNKGKNSYIDMQLMSACKHNIIANSSFSWWAAWLNNNPDKQVIAPFRWFQQEENPDIYPTAWRRM